MQVEEPLVTCRENRVGAASLSARGQGSRCPSSSIKAPWPEPGVGSGFHPFIPRRACKMALALWVFSLLGSACVVSANIFGEL